MGLFLLVLFAFPGLWGFARLFLLVVPVCGSWFGFSGLIGCLCWLRPYVGVWLLFIRCFFVSG